MLVFVVPLQSPAASTNWEKVSALAVRSLGAILQQTNPAFHVFLVCNEPPNALPVHPNLTVLRRDLPLPAAGARMLDKWSKVRIGLVAARRFAPCQIMVVDADDLVSNRLAAHCAANQDMDGWIFDKGWLYDEGSRWLFSYSANFDAICGTSSIVRVKMEDLPTEEEGGRAGNLILEAGHTKIRPVMRDRGRVLEPLPFRGAVYVLRTGENDSGFTFPGCSSLRWQRESRLLLR